MMDKLKTYCKELSLCEIYSNPDDTNKFCVGYVLAVDDNNCVVQTIDRYGAYDGVSCLFNEDIIQIRTDTKYLSAMLKLARYKGNNTIKDVSYDRLFRDILFDIKENVRICEIELCDSKLCDIMGYIRDFNDDNIKILCVDDFGENDGETIIDINTISHVSYDSIDTIRLEILHRETLNI